MGRRLRDLVQQLATLTTRQISASTILCKCAVSSYNVRSEVKRTKTIQRNISHRCLLALFSLAIHRKLLFCACTMAYTWQGRLWSVNSERDLLSYYAYATATTSLLFMGGASGVAGGGAAPHLSE